MTGSGPYSPTTPIRTRGSARSSRQENALVQTILTTQGEGLLEATGLDGVARLTAFTRLPDLPQTTPVYVSVGIPTDLAYAEVNRIWRRNLAWLGLMTFMMAILAWFGGYLLIRRRVQRLVQATRQLAAGDLDVRADIVGARDELSELGDAFDQMAVTLQQQAAEHVRLRASSAGERTTLPARGRKCAGYYLQR